jgi:hypothetical protein
MERITRNINLFLDLAEEIYTLVGSTLPDPVSILPKTNGVVIPMDIITEKIDTVTPQILN